MTPGNNSNLDGIAIIGLAGRFPGARDTTQFWQNLAGGVESIRFFSDDDFRRAGLDPAALPRESDFVRARAVVDGVDLFDAPFFGIDAREAELMDPQHRVFLEVASEALDNAGCDPERFAGSIGLFAGLSLNTYLLANLCSDRQYIENLITSYQLGEFQTLLGNDKDFLTTRVAYKLNLRGPAITVQCACSTSLVAVAQACQSLQNFQCDTALAGAVSITFPQTRGYQYQEGAMGSPDGHCRTFDAEARGTVFGDGCGIVVLKRLADAIADGDCIRAVIKGAAINNDGSCKVSYTAPSVGGQAEVIAAAQALANVEPESISYIEAHGTATPLGDLIEIAALTQAFRAGTDKKQFCAIGSAKTNFGHLDVASGVTGLIKTTLALEHGILPPSLHFTRPNPQIDFANSPFFVNAEARPWEPNGGPRRAGVSSFGVGGTNAHVIVEEAPTLPARSGAPGPQLLVLAAKTRTALDLATEALAAHLEANPDLDLRDVAFTLQTGRRAFDYRRLVLCDNVAEAVKLLRSPDPARVFTRGGRLPQEESPQLAAGRRWLMGQVVDWSELHAGTQPRRIPLPAYPFERQRYWIEPPHRKLTASSESDGSDKSDAVHASRKDRLLFEVKAVFTELSGENLAAANLSTSFFDLGLDSLFLTQAAQALRKKFKIKVSFRQLLDDLSTLGALVDYIDAQVPADQFTPAPASPAPAPAAESASPLDRMTQQLAEISKQIESLRSGASAPSAPSTPAVPAIEPKRFGPYKPIDRSGSAGFTPAQQAHLDALIARYTARTPKSKAFTQRHRARFADPRAVSGFRPFWKEMVYPIVARRSQGSRIWDIDGNEYVDVTMGFGTNLFGHSPEFVREAVRRQLEEGIEVGPTSPLAGEAAELFCDLTGHERVTFCSTGSEAILGAIRLARTVTGRTKIATTSEAYHGICDEVLVRAAGGKSQPVAPGIPAHAVSEVLVIEWGNPASLDLLRAHANELAAVLVESVQSRRPEIQPVEFIREIRRITRESGAVFILDEVITGFRAHPGGVQALWNIRADIATYGKIIGGGMPIGAIGGRAEYMDALDGGAWQYGDASFPEVGVTFFAGTYVRHPLAMAAAKAVFEHLRDAGPALQSGLAERTERFIAELNAFFESEGAAIHATHFTSMMYFQFGEAFRYPGLLFFHLREKGLHIWEGRPWFLSTAHTEEDIQFILRVFRETIIELKQGGFIGGVPALPPVPKVQNAIAPPPPIQPVQPVQPVRIPAPATAGAPLFSVYFFGSYPAEYSPSKYRLVIEATRLADARGFHAVWLPERHFHPVGGFSPNPSLLAAALARETRQIRLHGESVVVPLHHPVRIAEEWSVVDNISDGRAGISFASGWHPNDFIFAPGNFEKRRELYYEGIELIRRLWRGESANFQTGGTGRIDVQIHPRPKQAELPTWFTCIHHDAFVKAGELGANVLCHTVNHSLEEIAEKIAAYREARARAGFDRGHVTLLVHTFLAADPAQAVEQARQPFHEYLTAFLDNGKKKAESHGRRVEIAQEDMDEILALSYKDYVENKALIGSVESCEPVIDKLTAIGVDELGCFIDFGVATDAALASLERVAELKQRTEERLSGPPVPLVLPLPRAERGLWTLINAGKNASRVYNESITLALRGPLNIDALRKSLQFLVDRHEALRAVVSPDGDRQQILRDCPVDLEIRNFAVGRNGTRDAGVRGFFSQREAALFDFSRPPFVRASLAALGDSEHLLLLTFHHLHGNGPAYTMFLDELAAAYDALAGGATPRLERALQLHDFVAWRAAQEANQEESGKFWLSQFADGVPVLNLPADHPRPAVQSFLGGREILMLDEPLTKSLKAAAASQRCSLFMLLFTAYGVLLHRLSGQDDFVIGVAAEAEIRAEEAGKWLFANTTHMLPLRCRFDRAASFTDQVRVSKRLTLDASEHQQYFFGDLIRRLRLPRDPSRSALFSVTFNLETGEFRKQAGGVDFQWATDGQPYRGPAGTSMFDFYLNIAERDGGLLCEVDYSEIFDPATVRRWLAQFRALAGQIAQNPSAPISGPSLPDAPDSTPKAQPYAETEAALRRQPGVRDCAVIDREEESGKKRLVAYVVPERASRIELWPSSPSAGRGQFYDEALYRAMTNDHARNERFREAFQRTVRDKVVVDIGCGKDAILSRICIEAGARKVYAVELLESAAEQARALVRKMRLTERIVVVQGDVLSLELPELADVCVSENIGHVAGAEGWDLVLAKAARLLKPGAPMIPGRCETMAAAVSLPEEFMREPKFAEMAAYYVENLFNQAGYQFDLRLSITGTDRSHLRSTIGVFEEIDFHAPHPGYSRPLRLTVEKTSRIHGFLLWLNIHMAPGVVLDTIDNQASWLPVFLPVFPGGLAVQEGDVIDAEVTGSLAENGVNRDYAIRGSVLRGRKAIERFDFTSWHYKQVFRATPFYQTLFASGSLPVAPASLALASSTLSQALAAALPQALVPTTFVTLPVLPLLPNGKLDIKSLPAPGATPAGDFAHPVTGLEKKVANIWRRVLNIEHVGLRDNFFEVGGDSLMGLRVVNRLREALDEHVSLVVIFEAPTVERLSQLLERNYAEAVQRWVGVQAQGAASETTPRIGEPEIAKLSSLVAPMRKYMGSGAKNPSAVFILSPMRSGSTLLRIMLAGNSRLFAPPELELLCFENLAERKAAFTGFDKYIYEGVIRAVMEIRHCDAAQAESIIAGFERKGTDMKAFYGQMQEWIAPRLLVDKTPDYAMDIGILRRAEDIFENPLYIHLTRHPLGMIGSYEKGRFILESLFRGRHDFTARQLAELTWLISHRNITQFLHDIPENRQQRVRFEDLVSTPEPVLAGLCEWLEIPFAPEMADPYRGGSERMTDGIHPMSTQVGDVNFYQHGRLNPEVANSWKKSYTEDFLSPLTWELAGSFGYRNPWRTGGPTRSAIVPVQPGGSLSPLFFMHGDFVDGGLYCVKMARYIGLDRPFYAIDPHGVHDEAPDSIEEMAAARLELVRKIRPEGPYVLGGFCNGGLVAFEMARQLEAAGETVSSLVLLSVDGANTEFSWLNRLIDLVPGPGERKFRSFLQWRERILFARAAWSKQLDALVKPVPISEQPRRFARKAGRIARKALSLTLPTRGNGSSAAENGQRKATDIDIGHIYREACTAYVPRRYRGPAHLLWPSEIELRDPSAGWLSVIPQLDVIKVPGGHFSTLKGENLRAVSEIIRECLLKDHA